MTKVILFNGPSQTGKDFAVANLLSQSLFDESEIIHLKFAAPLKVITSLVFGMTIAELEKVKDKTLTSPLIMKPRDAQIMLGELVKQAFGSQIFGSILVNNIRRANRGIVLVSDLGFREELIPIIKEVGANNILVIQIARQGHTFINDSREYVNDPRVTTEMLINDGTHAFIEQVFTTVVNFLDNQN